MSSELPSRSLRCVEAAHIRAGEPVSLGDATWTVRAPAHGAVFWVFISACFWFLVGDIPLSSLTADAVGRLSVVVVGTFAILLTTLAVSAVAATVRGTSIHLDAKGISYLGHGYLLAGPARYRWTDFEPFTATWVKTGVCVARCHHASGSFNIDADFGDPADIVTILNAYRSAHTRSGGVAVEFRDAGLGGRLRGLGRLRRIG